MKPLSTFDKTIHLTYRAYGEKGNKMEKYRCLLNGKVFTVIKREGDNVTYICDGFVHHANIDWFMENCKKL